jgi:hypothetical protein
MSGLEEEKNVFFLALFIDHPEYKACIIHIERGRVHAWQIPASTSLL